MKVSRRSSPSASARWATALPRWAAITAAAALLVVLPAHAASAHDELVSADPAADSVVASLPSELTLRFSGELVADDGTAEIVVTAPDGSAIQQGAPTIDGAIVTQAIENDSTAQGTVVVQWRVVSGDGHPVSGEFVFGLGEEPSEVDPPVSEEEQAADTALTLLGIVVGLVVAGIVVTVVVALIMRNRRRTRPGTGPGAK